MPSIVGVNSCLNINQPRVSTANEVSRLIFKLSEESFVTLADKNRTQAELVDLLKSGQIKVSEDKQNFSINGQGFFSFKNLANLKISYQNNEFRHQIFEQGPVNQDSKALIPSKDNPQWKSCLKIESIASPTEINLQKINERKQVTQFLSLIKSDIDGLNSLKELYSLSAGKSLLSAEQKEETIKNIDAMIGKYVKMLANLGPNETFMGNTCLIPSTQKDIERIINSGKLSEAINSYTTLLITNGEQINSLIERARIEPFEFPTKGDVVGVFAGVISAKLAILAISKLGLTNSIIQSLASATGFTIANRSTSSTIDGRALPYRTDSPTSFANDVTADIATTWVMFGALKVGADGWQALAEKINLSASNVLLNNTGKILSEYVTFVGAQTAEKSIVIGEKALSQEELSKTAKDSAIMLGLLKFANVLLGPALVGIDNEIAKNQIQKINTRMEELCYKLTGSPSENARKLLVLRYQLFQSAFNNPTQTPPAVKRYMQELRAVNLELKKTEGVQEEFSTTLKPSPGGIEITPVNQNRISLTDAIELINRNFQDNPQLKSLLIKYLQNSNTDLVRYLRDPERSKYTIDCLKELSLEKDVIDEQTIQNLGQDSIKIIDFLFDGTIKVLDRKIDLQDLLMSQNADLYSLKSAKTTKELLILSHYVDECRSVQQNVANKLGQVLKNVEYARGFENISTRTKSYAEVLDKLKRMQEGNAGRPPRPDYSIKDMPDILGARVTIDKIDDLPKITAEIEKEFGKDNIFEVDNFYLNSQKNTGPYRVITFTITIDNGMGKKIPFELQVTTLKSSVVADLEHDGKYKEKISVSSDEKDEIIKLMWSALKQEISKLIKK